MVSARPKAPAASRPSTRLGATQSLQDVRRSRAGERQGTQYRTSVSSAVLTRML
jgi:hypothetical protein